VQCTTASIAPFALHDKLCRANGIFFFYNCGPQNEPYLLKRKKMTKWYIKLFRRLLSITILNCMVICRTNSGQAKIDHFKLRVELVQALLIEHQSENVRKFQGHHSTDKKVP